MHNIPSKFGFSKKCNFVFFIAVVAEILIYLFGLKENLGRGKFIRDIL